MAQPAVVQLPSTGNDRTDDALEALAELLAQILTRLHTIEKDVASLKNGQAALKNGQAAIREDIADLQDAQVELFEKFFGR